MSILKEPYAVPSRVKGVVRYLLAERGQREKRETLESLLSPTALRGRRDMVKATIRECLKMGLLEENEDGLEVAIKRNLSFQEEILPSILVQLMFNTSEVTENYDFAKVLAWYMAQDCLEAPGNWDAVEKKLLEQIGGDLLELNSVRFGQFENWICYLGFGWHHSLSGNSILVPDPTVYLRNNLNNLFDEINTQLPLGSFINRLGSCCPVFETGIFREEFGIQFGEKDEGYLSSTTSMALRRLEEEGKIKLEQLADTTVFILRDGINSRISHITWLG